MHMTIGERHISTLFDARNEDVHKRLCGEMVCLLNRNANQTLHNCYLAQNAGYKQEEHRFHDVLFAS